MARNYIALIALAAVGIMGSLTAHAQERTAGNTTDLQMTWATLSNQITAVKNLATAVSSRVDMVAACGKLGLVYAPGAPGNVNGCLYPSIPVSVTNAITNNTNNVANLQTNVTNLLSCADNGQVYDKTTGKCVGTDMTVVRLGSPVSYSMSTGSSRSGVSANYAIPAGTSVIIANVACSVFGSRAIIDSSINFNNSGGYPANEFCYLGGVSGNNTATNKDTKYIPVPSGATTFSISYTASTVEKSTSLNGTMTFMGRK